MYRSTLAPTLPALITRKTGLLLGGQHCKFSQKFAVVQFLQYRFVLIIVNYNNAIGNHRASEAMKRATESV